MTKLAFSASAVSDSGLKRRSNLDRYYVSPDERLFVIADGFGVAPEGTIAASHLGVETLKTLWNEQPPALSNDAEIREWLRGSITKANDAIYSSNSRTYSTLLAGVRTDHNKFHFAHLGDSRAYVMRNGMLVALTEDHTFLNLIKKQNPELYEKVTNGGVTACYTPRLLRSLGFEQSVEVDLTETEVIAGGWLLLCTDGLYIYVRDDEIAQILSDSATADEACKKLLARTIDEGAPDNVTIIVVKY